LKRGIDNGEEGLRQRPDEEDPMTREGTANMIVGAVMKWVLARLVFFSNRSASWGLRGDAQDQ
jgi:hypothetical protein